MDQPTYSPVQPSVERSGTLFVSFQDLDATQPSGSVKIRTETIAHYLRRDAKRIMEHKLAAMAGRPFPFGASAAVLSGAAA